MNRLARTVAATLVAMTMVACDDDDPAPRGVDGGKPAAADAGRSDVPVSSPDVPVSTPEVPGPTPDASAPVDMAAGDVAAPNLYQRLGGEPGIRTVITDFVVNRVLNDAKINGYFLNASVSGTKLIDCLVLQVGSLTGGPQVYPSNGCRDMKSSHAGLKISMNDFNDLAGHLVAALVAAKVPQSDIDIIVGAVAPMSKDIVEDANNTGTVYQRLGRKPGIGVAIDNFIGRVVKDARINGFFAAANAARLKTCLVRQVCSIDGPCAYGKEVAHPSEPGVGPGAMACKDMKSSHAGMTSPPGGGAGAKTISIADFSALVEDLVLELDALKVPAADKNAILAALGPTCDDIVAGGTGCPGRTIVALTALNTLVTFDSKTPGTVSTPVVVTGLGVGENLVGLTYRPIGARLYGLSSASRLFEINRTTGAATVVGTAAFTPALAGAIFGFDFNPTVDRIRVVSDTGQNLRLHPDMGAVVMNMADTALSPAGAAVSGVAYTNSVVGATTTTLYGIDVNGNKLVRQGGPDGMPSPNLGVLSDVGALGVDPAGAAGFDIAPGSNAAYATLSVAGTTGLYTVNLATGAATLVGPIGGAVGVRAIAVVP